MEKVGKVTQIVKTTKKTIMIENEDGRTTPYVIKELEPQVEGILVSLQVG